MSATNNGLHAFEAAQQLCVDASAEKRADAERTQREFCAAAGLVAPNAHGVRTVLADEPKRLTVTLGSRVRTIDKEEDEREAGTVIATTLSGGIKVRWDLAGEVWTHDRASTLSLVPEWVRPDCQTCNGTGVAVLYNGGWAKDALLECADCRRALLNANPRYSALECRPCRGAGFTRTATTRTECTACNGAGATAVLQHGYYEPVTEGEEPEPRGRELADATQLRDRLLSWAGALAESVANGRPLSRDEALMLRDELVLHVEALDQHRERADERELEGDLRDDELQELHAHLAEVERERDEAREGAATLKAALAAEHTMRAEDAETISDMRARLEKQSARIGTLMAERDAAIEGAGEAVVTALQAGAAL